MEYKRLGNSALNISRIGFGCMSLDPMGADTENILHKALDGGINYFDTADMYQKGQNEIMLGRAFHEKRNRVILATKVGHQWRANGSGWDWNPTKKYILSSIEESLKRLQTDCIDLYQLHGGTMDDPMDDVIEAFESLVAAGKIRFYGISSIRPNVIREYVKRSAIISVMLQYSLLDRRPEEEILEFLKANRVGVLARGTVAKGLLVSKTPEEYLNFTKEEVSLVSDGIASVAGLTNSKLEIATQYVLHHEAVTSAILGIRTEQQLKEALAEQPSDVVDEEQMRKLRNILPANKYTEHR